MSQCSNRFKVAITRCCNKTVMACAIPGLDEEIEEQFSHYKRLGLRIKLVPEVQNMGICECEDN